jgi:hypothetical protein
MSLDLDLRQDLVKIRSKIRIPNTWHPHNFYAGSAPGGILMPLRFLPYCKASQNVENELINCVTYNLLSFYVDHPESTEPELLSIAALDPPKLFAYLRLKLRKTNVLIIINLRNRKH